MISWMKRLTKWYDIQTLAALDMVSDLPQLVAYHL